jgi:hypothetical protein
LASELPLTATKQLLRVVCTDEVGADGKIFSTAFTPRAERDQGLLSMEHGDPPGGAQAYRGDCGLQDIEGIYAVTVGECTLQELPCIDDGGDDGLSSWHVSVDFRAYVNASNQPTGAGKRKARALATYARQRRKQA